MRESLTHLEFINDFLSATLLNFHATEMIYNQLKYLINLHSLGIMALKNTHQFENLDSPTHLKNLTIATLKFSYLPRLYQTLTQIIVDKIKLEECKAPNIHVKYNPFLTHLKLQTIKK